jgi:hypothetical protein
MATYHKRIKGKNYDGKLISKADRSVKGRGDGRISLNDARAILKTVKDSDNYTDIEKATMRHIRDNYDFTPEADRWFRTQIRKWAATKAPGSAAKKAAVKKARPKPAARKKAALKKPAVKKKAAKRPARRPAAPTVRKPTTEQEYIAPPSELIEREPVSSTRSRSKAPAVILVILIAAIIGLFIFPKSREWIKNKFSTSSPATETVSTTIKPSTEPTPPAPIETAKPEKKEAATAKEKEKPVPPPVEEGNIYIVQAHEGLVQIAEQQLGDYKKWVDIYRLNSATIPNTLQLYIGQKLKLPEGAKVKK